MEKWNEIVTAELPPVGEPLIVTVRDRLQGLGDQLRYPVYFVKDAMKDDYAWKWFYGDMVYDLLPDVSEVIAWQHFPAVFESGCDKAQNAGCGP